VGEEPFGRMLSGIRGVRIEVTEVRAKFTYGGNKAREVQRRVTGLLARRDGPRDRAARAQQVRRLAAADREP
jgi:transcriptional regulator